MNRPFRTLALTTALVAIIPAACSAQVPSATTPIAPPPAATPAAPLVTGLPDFTQLVQKVGPAVVNITAEIAPRRIARQGQMPDDEAVPEIFRRFFGPDMPFPGGPGQDPRGGGGVSQGTGFLISQDGYLLTNHHVVAGAETVKVRLNDRREFTAKVIGSDEASDVALLKVDARDLPFLRMANAAHTKPGQKSASGKVPKRVRRAHQPATAPGTVTVWIPMGGMYSKALARKRSALTPQGDHPPALRPKVLPVFASL